MASGYSFRESFAVPPLFLRSKPPVDRGTGKCSTTGYALGADVYFDVCVPGVGAREWEAASTKEINGRVKTRIPRCLNAGSCPRTIIEGGIEFTLAFGRFAGGKVAGAAI